MSHDPIAGPDMDTSIRIGQQRRGSAQLPIKQCNRQNEGQRRERRHPAEAGICIYSLDATYTRVSDHFSHLSFATPENPTLKLRGQEAPSRKRVSGAIFHIPSMPELIASVELWLISSESSGTCASLTRSVFIPLCSPPPDATMMMMPLLRRRRRRCFLEQDSAHARIRYSR